MLEFLFCSDNHAGVLNRYFPNKPWLDWSFEALHQVQNYAQDNGIKNIFHGADFWDSFPTQAMEVYASNFFKQYNDSGVMWHMLGGNHGVRSSSDHSLLKLKSETENGWLTCLKIYLKPERFKLNGVRVIMLPWPLLESPLLDCKRSLVFAHEERAGFKNDNGTGIKGNVFDLKGHFWFIGHLHTCQIGKDVAFVGSTCQTNFGEGNKHYFFHVKVGKDLKPKIKKILIHNPYELVNVRIDKESDWKQLDKLKDDQYIRIVRNASVAIPDEYRDFPKIVGKEKVYGNRQDLESIRRDAVNIEYTGVSVRSRVGLMKKSLSKSSLNPKQKKLALKLFKKGIEELQFQKTGIR